jgi:hypothetical protein
MSGNRCIAARLSSVVRCVYWRETAALSCPTISRAIKSATPAAFSIVTALWRKLWNEISLASARLVAPIAGGDQDPAASTNIKSSTQSKRVKTSRLKFHGRFVRYQDFWLQNCAILCNALRMLNCRITYVCGGVQHSEKPRKTPFLNPYQMLYPVELRPPLARRS